MSQKVVDILPPKKSSRNVVPGKKRKRKDNGKREKFEIFLFSLLFIFFILFLVSFKLEKVDVNIWPQLQSLNFKVEVLASSKTTSLDFQQKAIPATVFEVEKTIEKEFPSSGETLAKAEGTIRLYNAFSTKSEVWRRGTRFISEDGRLFKSKEKINVPGARMVKGKLVPSYVDVPVVAAEGGSDYNIGPSKFSVLVYRGTPRFTKFYGESLQQMKGGGKVSQVQEQDLEEAKKKTISALKLDCLEALREKAGDKYYFMRNGVKIDVLEATPLAKAGEEKESFPFRAKAKATLITFRKEDSYQFAKEYLLSRVPKENLLLPDSLDVRYSLDNSDFSENKLLLIFNISGKTYPRISLNELKKSLADKSLREARASLINQFSLEKIQFSLFPPWARKMPSDIKRIKVFYPLH